MGVSATTYDTSQVQRALGIRSQVNPTMDAGTMSQVIILGDMSQSFGAQQFEARAVISPVIVASAGSFAYVEVQSNAAGGIVIETVDIYNVEAVGLVPEVFVKMRVGAKSVPNTAGSTPTIMEVGGSSVSSKPVALTTASIQAGPFFQLDPDGRISRPTFNWFVPSGSVFCVASCFAADHLRVSIQWREIPQAPGGA